MLAVGPARDNDAANSAGGVSWRDRRAVGVLALVASGYALGAAGVLPAAPAWAALVLGLVIALAALFLRGAWCRAALAIAVVTLAFGWFRARCDESPGDALALMLGEQPALIRVEGVALSTPAFDPPEADPLDPDGSTTASPWGFELRTGALVGADGSRSSVSGVIRVRASFEPEKLRAGQRVVVRGFARGPAQSMNPGEPDRARLARQAGIAGSMQVPTPEFLEISREPPTTIERARAWWLGSAERLRAAANQSLAPHDGSVNPRRDEGVALLRAMLLGHRDDDLRDLSGAFTRVGLAHVLSVSGMNLTLLAAFALYAVRLLGDRPRFEKLAVGALLAIYLVVVPPEAPIVRAALMIGVFLIAEWGGRRYDRLNTLAWAAVVSLLWRPMDLWSAGFQLSYVGVASLIVLAAPVRARLFGAHPEDDALGGGLRGVLLRLLEALKTAFAVTLCTWLATSPLVLYHTGVVSLIGPVANLVVWPLVTIITGAGYALVLVGTILPSAASWATPALHGVAELLAWLVRALDAVPGATATLPLVSVWWGIAATGVSAWWALRARPALPTIAQRRRGWMLTAGAAGVVLLWLGAEVRLRPGVGRDEVEVAVLHLPGGSCTAMISGREAVLYDAGSSLAGAGRRLIPRALREIGVASVRTVIISHADAARFNALPDLVRPLGVREVLVGEQFLRFAADRPAPDGAAANLIRALEELGVAVRGVAEGESLALGGATLRVLAPAPGAKMRTHRDASLVVEVESPGGAEPRAAVLLGDVGREGFESLHGRLPSLPSQVLIAPRVGWAANRVDELALWAAGPSTKPVVIQPDSDRVEPAGGVRVLNTRETGCIRVLLRGGSPPAVTLFRRPQSAPSAAPSPSP
ncbi:MAG: ComEC/Rec2 family competence protein [Phycisphaerales bacterium]